MFGLVNGKYITDMVKYKVEGGVMYYEYNLSGISTIIVLSKTFRVLADIQTFGILGTFR